MVKRQKEQASEISREKRNGIILEAIDLSLKRGDKVDNLIRELR